MSCPICKQSCPTCVQLVPNFGRSGRAGFRVRVAGPRTTWSVEHVVRVSGGCTSYDMVGGAVVACRVAAHRTTWSGSMLSRFGACTWPPSAHITSHRVIIIIVKHCLLYADSTLSLHLRRSISLHASVSAHCRIAYTHAANASSRSRAAQDSRVWLRPRCIAYAHASIAISAELFFATKWAPLGLLCQRVQTQWAMSGSCWNRSWRLRR